MLITGYGAMDAEHAFTRATRARRRAALARAVRRRPAACGRLAVLDVAGRAVRAPRGVGEIALDEIRGTLEPSRAAQFDSEFRPAGVSRTRWQRLWLARQRGAVLPPVSVVSLDDGYALRDGHHRVSVARAQGALTIDAIIDAD
jgi:hypothetical protein